MSKLIDWGLTAVTKALLKDGAKDGKTQAVADTVDKLTNAFFDKDAPTIKMFLVTYMIIPIGKHLTRETKDGWQKALTGEAL